MKIAHINGTYGVGSTGRLIKDLVEWGRLHENESRVFYSERANEAPEAEQYISAGQRKCHALQSRISGLQGYWSRRATMRLIERIRAFSPDLVHLHVVHGNCLHLPLLFNDLHGSRLPVVITLHDCWWFTGRCVHPSVYQCDKFTTGCTHCPANRDCNPSWFFDRAQKMLLDKQRWLLGIDRLAVVAVSDWVARQAKDSFLPERYITRIYNWVDADAFYPVDSGRLKEDMGLTGCKVVLGVADRWESRKGLPDLIALAEDLPQEYRLVLVGRLPEGISLPARILQIPHTDSCAQLAQLYSMADVFVNLSRMETFGLTTAEAMACGTPAIVYDATACPELIGPGTGKAIPLWADRNELLAAVIECCNSPKEPDVCREWVREKFDRDRNCRTYYELYKKVMCP